MVVANEKLAISKSGEQEVKGTLGDFKAHSQHEEFLKSSVQAKRAIVLSDFFLPVRKLDRGIYDQGSLHSG